MFHRILVPTDLTDSSRRAIETAVHLAAPRAADLCLLHVIERVPNLDDPEMRVFYDKLEHDARWRMRELVAAAKTPGGLAVQQVVTLGRRADEIVRVAHESEADLIVLQHDINRAALLGSISYKVTVLAPCAVLLLK